MYDTMADELSLQTSSDAGCPPASENPAYAVAAKEAYLYKCIDELLEKKERQLYEQYRYDALRNSKRTESEDPFKKAFENDAFEYMHKWKAAVADLRKHIVRVALSAKWCESVKASPLGW